MSAILSAAYVRKLSPDLAAPSLDLSDETLEPDQAFGQALRYLRTKRGWTQVELALRADVDRNYVSLIELGRNSPSVRMVFRLCDALDVSPADLMRDVERRMKAHPQITGGTRGSED